MASQQQQQQETKTIPLKVLIDKHSNKVVFVKATKDFVDTLFSFLSLPLATIVRLLAATENNNEQQLKQQSESSPFLGNIKNLYQTVENLNSNDVWNNHVCKHMLLNPKNPCESLCMDLFLNIDDTEPSTKFYGCESGISISTQLEEVTHNIGKHEILNLLKYSLTSHEPLTNTLLASSSKIKENPPNKSASAVKVMPCTSDRSKMDIKILQSKSQKKIITAEADGDFVDFIFNFLTMPLGSIVKLLGCNTFAGCVGNLYKSLENLDPTSVLLNPGIAPQFGCPNQPLNIPHLQPPSIAYYYNCFHNGRDYPGGLISKSGYFGYPSAHLLDPKEGAVGFVKRATLYGVGDDLKVKPLAANSFLPYLNELSVPLDDLEVKVISFGETEALRFLGAFLTSKFTLTSGLQDIIGVPRQESTLLKVPKQETTILEVPKQES
ncbi:uncharacterized protein LOC123922035 [Trifolium pratense]|uniref:uncharacterized protein LOC123922035 n=1 Tax=Trifolium pratense TaxID=57577 RepID=UPI001E691A9E|nr:uncharacterized protein LOC123922035 [Trifolium pratense]